MTLVVCVSRREDDGRLTSVELEPCDGGEPSLAGFENWRSTVWGSAVSRRLGCKLLPLLATQDLHAELDDITLVMEDVARLREHIAEVAAAGSDPNSVLFRLDTLARAAAVAASIPDRRGHLTVW